MEMISELYNRNFQSEKFISYKIQYKFIPNLNPNWYNHKWIGKGGEKK